MTDPLFALTPILVTFCVALGLLLGSFLNVVIHRVPAGLSVITPRSSCPTCFTQIRSRDNIPVFSWILLRGRCRDCSAPISTRYPTVELVTAVLFGLLAWWFGFVGVLPILLYLAAIGVALFMIDLDHQRLPDAIVLPAYGAVVAGLVLAGLIDGDWPWIRSLASAAIWFFMFAIPWFATAGRGMGFGDVKLAPLLGAVLGWLGWGASLVGLMAGFFFGAVVGVLLIAAAKAGRKSRVPYGPFMLIGAFFGALTGNTLAVAYLRFFGL